MDSTSIDIMSSYPTTHFDGIATDEEFEAAFGTTFEQTLDLNNWSQEEDLAAAYGRMDQEVTAAIDGENRYRQRIRDQIFSPDFFADLQRQQQLSIAGKYAASPNDIQRVQTNLLFSGAVEACDGINVAHDTLPLTIIQLGVCLVSYSGADSTYSQRLYRRDLRLKMDDPIAEIRSLLGRRQKREAQGSVAHSMSELARRSLMTYAERAILARKSTAPWRMGHGSPAPYELLTNFWTSADRIHISLDLIRWYVLKHQRFVFVPSAPRDRHLLTLGHALEPLEYLIIGTLQSDIDQLIQYGSYRERSGVLRAMKEFRDEIATQIVVGLYRVWEGSPPYLFYAHVKHADMAAHIAIADSLLQEHRGFPMLIDLADSLCKVEFGGNNFYPAIQTAYADAGQPYRYFGERETRYR